MRKLLFFRIQNITMNTRINPHGSFLGFQMQFNNLRSETKQVQRYSTITDRPHYLQVPFVNIVPSNSYTGPFNPLVVKVAISDCQQITDCQDLQVQFLNNKLIFKNHSPVNCKVLLFLDTTVCFFFRKCESVIRILFTQSLVSTNQIIFNKNIMLPQVI